MLSISNKASAFGAAIILAAAFTICTERVAAQTTASVNRVAIHANATIDTNRTDPATKSVPPAEDSKLTTATEETPEANQPPILDPDSANTSVTTKVDKGRPAIINARTTTPQAVDDDAWQFQFTPYFWLASLHGTGGVGNRTAEVDMSFGDIFGDLKFALMGVFEARKGKFISLTDLEYVSIESESATPGPLFSNVTAGFKTFIFDQEVGYRFYEDPDKAAYVDVVGGVRVWHVSTDLNFGAGFLPAQQIDGSRNWVDGVVGLRAKTAVSKKMFVSGKFDLGGGGSDFTWQVFAGGGYNINPKVALIVGYRVLDVNYNKNNFIYDMNQRGPIMGIGFKF